MTKPQFKYKINAEFLSKKLQKISNKKIIKTGEKIMEFIKTILKNRNIIWKLGKSDFKNRFASTSLGSIWGFLQPFIFQMMYVNTYLNRQERQEHHMLYGSYQEWQYGNA